MDTQVNFAILNDQLADDNAQLKARIEQLTAEIEQLKTINEYLLARSDLGGKVQKISTASNLGAVCETSGA